MRESGRARRNEQDGQQERRLGEREKRVDERHGLAGGSGVGRGFFRWLWLLVAVAAGYWFLFI